MVKGRPSGWKEETAPKQLPSTKLWIGWKGWMQLRRIESMTNVRPVEQGRKKTYQHLYLDKPKRNLGHRRQQWWCTGTTAVVNRWTDEHLPAETRWLPHRKYYCTKPLDWILQWTVHLPAENRCQCLSSNQTRISKHTTLPVLWQEAEKVECSLKAANSTAIDIAWAWAAQVGWR